MVCAQRAIDVCHILLDRNKGNSQPRQHEVGPTWYIIRLCITDQTGPSLGVLRWLVRLRKVSLSAGHCEPPNVVDV